MEYGISSNQGPIPLISQVLGKFLPFVINVFLQIDFFSFKWNILDVKFL